MIEQQQALLYDFRTVHLFEDINRQLLGIFQLQQQYSFFYLDTLEVLRAYSTIKEKHQQNIQWQLQQIEWMFEFNVFRGAFQSHASEKEYKKLAWLFWMTMDNWMYARKISGGDHLKEEDFLQSLWSLMVLYFTEEGKQEFKALSETAMLPFISSSYLK